MDVGGQMRFVVLLHEGYGERHWDLFLEVEGREKLMAWHVMRGPEEWARAAEGEIGAKRIGDHRKLYMTYEGEVSGGRGTVKRVAEGMAVLAEAGERVWRLRLVIGGRELAIVLPV
jgi:hypothetical protein